MARQRKKSGLKTAGTGWLITYSDLMTLLLSFFVLLLSMSSMDRTLLTRISAMPSDISIIDHAGRGRIPERIRLLLEVLREPKSLAEKLDRIKDLLFPDDVLPPGLSTSTLGENLKLLSNPEGLVIVLTEGLLFAPGESALGDTGKKLLEAMAPFLQYSTADVNISGHTDSSIPRGVDPYELSGKRALSVLEYFLHQKIRPARFSISAYGPDRPMTTGDAAAGQGRNRRVEILVKTTQNMGRYP